MTCVTLFYTFFGGQFSDLQNRSRWPLRATHSEAKRHFREILVPKWPPKWSQKVIEFWLRWNCDFCYPSHAKSLFSLPRNPPKRRPNLFKKILCNQTLPKSLVFRTGRPWMASWTEKGSKRDPKIEPPGRPTYCENQWFWGSSPPPPPQEPQSLDFGSSSNQFWTIFSCFESIFIDLFQYCLHLLCAPGRSGHPLNPYSDPLEHELKRIPKGLLPVEGLEWFRGDHASIKLYVYIYIYIERERERYIQFMRASSTGQ